MVQGMSLALPPGEVWGLLGPNGAGKSTLLKGIMGFPWVWRSGEFLVDGRPLEERTERERACLIGYLPQDPPVPQGLTVRETVLLGRHPFRSPWAPDSREDRDTAAAVMETCDILHLAERPAANLSGGEQKLVFLASVLVQRPAILLLDEPGSGLDYRHTGMLWEILSLEARRGVSVLACTHRLGMAGEHLSGVVLLGHGRCMGSGPPEHVLSPDLLSAVYGVPLDIARNPDTGGWIVSAGRRP